MDNIYHSGVSREGVAIHTGFPNPAIDASLKELDLNQLLIAHSLSSYMMRVSGDDWSDYGIFDGDLVIIDRALPVQPNDLTAWWHEDSFCLSYRSDVPKSAVIWGVVTSTTHVFRSIQR